MPTTSWSLSSAVEFATDLPLHDIAWEVVPEQDDSTYSALVQSINILGQINPGVHWHNKLGDGRHRQRACRQLGILFKSQEFRGDEVQFIEYVRAQNLRRHESDSQKVTRAIRMLNTDGCDRSKFQEYAERCMVSGLPSTQSQKMRNAWELLEQNSELFEEVHAGKIALAHAMSKLHGTPVRTDNLRGVYRWTYGDHSYVGQSIDVGARLHKEMRTKFSTLDQPFTIHVLPCDEGELDRLEQEWINIYQPDINIRS